MTAVGQVFDNPRQEKVVKTSALADQLRDFDFTYLTHPAVALGYVLLAPVLVGIVGGFTLRLFLAEIIAAATVAALALASSRLVSALSPSGHSVLRLATLAALIVVSQVVARMIAPEIATEVVIRDTLTRGPDQIVVAFAVIGFSLHHIFLWLLLMVLVGGSFNYRKARRLQLNLLEDIRSTSGFDGVSEQELATRQRDSVQEISRRIGAIEVALSDQPERHAEELTQAVRELRQEVVRPSLDQLNALVASARATPRVSESVSSRLASVPWRWKGTYFSGSVGALLIGVVGMLILAPTTYYSPGNLLQLPLLLLAFFVSVPSALLLMLAAALTPVLSPESASVGGLLFVSLILILGGISFLQRFNRVRQVRAVESMSVLSAQVALDQVRRAQDLKVLEDRINSILHGSVQSTLLALELGLQAQDGSVEKHSREALRHLKKAMAVLEAPTAMPSESFERALENIISVWAGSLQFSVDQSPDAADALDQDPLAASAVIEVVKEGTQNAVKHSGTRNVRVVISRDGSSLRVRVSHPSAGLSAPASSEGIGLRYLTAITQTLRLIDDGVTTTLYAEIPTQAPSPSSDALV